MRALLLAALLASSAAAQTAPRPDVVPFAGFGFGVVADAEAGWLAVALDAGARAGVPTAALRVTARNQLFSRDERWDVAALGGATLSGPVGMASVTAGPSLAGGIDKGSCFLSSFPCGTVPGRRLPVRLGLGIAAEAGVRLPGRTFLIVQATANLTGARTTQGLVLGGRKEF